MIIDCNLDLCYRLLAHVQISSCISVAWKGKFALGNCTLVKSCPLCVSSNNFTFFIFYVYQCLTESERGAQWLSGRVLDSRPRGHVSSLSGVTAL